VAAPQNYTISTNDATICISTLDSISSININGNGNRIYFCGEVKVGQIGGFGTQNDIIVHEGSKLTIYSDFSVFQNLQLIANYGNIVFAGGASNLYAPIISINHSTATVIGDATLNSGSTPGGAFYMDDGVLTVTGTLTLNGSNPSVYPGVCIISYSQVNINNLVVNSFAPFHIESSVTNICLNVSGAVTLNAILTEQPLNVCMAPSAFYTNPFNTNWGANVTVTENCTESCISPLPLTLLLFNVNENPNGVLLSWATSHEIGTNYFDVEKSEDAIHYQKIGTVKTRNDPAIAANYSFLDISIQGKTSYYRLKFVDIDGTFTYSPIKTFSQSQSAGDISIGSGKNIVVKFLIPASGTLNLFDMQGRLLTKTSVNRTQNNIQLNTSGLSAGSYIVQFQSQNNIILKSSKVLLIK